MDCKRVLDMVYDSEEELSFFYQIQIWFHAYFCEDCAQKIEQYQRTRVIMKNKFFPSSPSGGNSWSNIEESIMARVKTENVTDESASESTFGEPVFSPIGIFSTRGWVITGLIIIVSMVTAFLGFDFQKLANEHGISFMLPMGITIGIVLTIYGAFFIGSHLKEFSERFGH